MMTLSYAHRSAKIRHEVQQLIEEPGFQRERVTGFREAIDFLLNLPFSDDVLVRIIKKLRQFEGFHAVYICQNLLLPLLKTLGNQLAVFQNESENLVDLFHSYCVAVNTDFPRRISLSEFSAVVRHAVDHCYKSRRPAKFLSTFWVSNYLNFLRVLIVANIAENYEKSFQEASDAETVSLFTKCVGSFEARLGEPDFIEILNVTIDYAELDGNLRDYKRSLKLFLESARPVANLLMEWIKLLQFPFISNNFAVRVARIDETLNKRSEYAKRREETGYIPYFEEESFTYRVSGALQRMEIENESFEISQDENKLEVFCKNYDSVHQYPELWLKLLSSEHISSTELSDIFNLLRFELIDKSFFFPRLVPTARDRSFWILSQILSKFRVFRQLVTILHLWKTHFPTDSQYKVLVCLLEFAWYPVQHFRHVKMENHLHDLSEFLSRLPKDLLYNIHVWKDLFSHLIRIFGFHWNRIATDVFLIRFLNETFSCWDLEINRDLNNDKFQNLQTLVQCLILISEVKADIFFKEELIWLMFDFLALIPAPAFFNAVARDLIPHLWYLGAISARVIVLELIKGLKEGVIQLEAKDISTLLASVSSIYDGNERALVHAKLLLFTKMYRDNKHSRSTLTLLQHSMQLNLPAKSKVLIARTFLDSRRMRLFSFIPEWLLTQRGVPITRLDESLKILTAAMERTLGYNEQLCTKFRDQFTPFSQSVSSEGEVFNFLVAATAGALSTSTFDFKIDPLCVLALEDVNDLTGYQLLSLYRHIRSGFLEVRHLVSKDCVVKGRCNEELSVETSYNQDLVDLAKSLKLVISCRAPVLQKIRLVKTVFSLFVGREIRPPNHLFGAITLIVPTTYTKFIIDCLNDPHLMKILGRIWEGGHKLHSQHATSGESLSAVLARRFPEAFQNKDAVKIYRSLLRFSEESPTVLGLFMFVVRQLLQQSNSLSTFFNRLQNLEGLLRKSPTNTTPFLLMCLREAFVKHMEDEEIEEFTRTLSGGLLSECDLTLLAGLKVPQFLIDVFDNSVDVQERTNLVQRTFQILAKLPKELTSRIISKVGMDPDVSKERHVLCLGFKWIIQSSSLSLTDAFLVLELCLDAPSLMSLPWPSCSSVSPNEAGSRILQSKLAGFERDSISAITDGQSQRTVQHSATGLKVSESNGKRSEPEISEFLTPAVVAHDLIVMFRKLANDDHCAQDRVESSVKQAFHFLFSEPKGFPIGGCCPEGFKNVTEKVFSCLIRILMSSKSLSAPLLWLELSHHHFVQCSEIILNFCRWYPAKEARPDKILYLQRKVESTLTLLKRGSDATGFPSKCRCYQGLKNKIDDISLILSMNFDLEITSTLLDLTVSDSQLSSTCAQIISVWTDDQEKKNLVEKLTTLHTHFQTVRSTANVVSFIYKFLVPAGRIFVNSVEDVLHARNELISIVELQEIVRLERFFPWMNEMFQSGVSCKAIDTWCTSFLFAKDTTSRDIDAICNLTMKAFAKMPSVYEFVTQCLFTEDIKERLWRENRLLEDEFKCCLRLARLLNEFVTIAQQTTSVTTSQEGEVLRILAEACQQLCQHFLENSSSSKKMYKIHHDTLVLLFYHIFCDKDDNLASDSTKSDEIEETVLRRLKDGKVFDVMLSIMRRWLTSIQKRSQLSAHVRNIVQMVMSANPKNTLASKVPMIPPSNLQSAVNVEDIIHCYVESLEGNQAAIARLRTAQYNQGFLTSGAGANDELDLWRSPFIELPCYVNKSECPETKKLAQNLKTLWVEWKDILIKANIKVVKVNNTEFEVKSLFKCTNNLQEMEHQVEAVKEVTRDLNSENLVHWRQNLLRREELQRRKFKKLCSKTKEEGLQAKTRVSTKLVIVWENRFLESAKLCAEKIPGCYAPNGFHSEKPVLCGLRKDNKILALFKEKNSGVREELENVEVRLYEAGMYVFGLHSDTHEFVTDELWAAFYQMLLQRKLVPTIILSNISPAFEWIKQFVKPDPGPPEPWGLNYYQSVVPPNEDDAIDHDPKLLKYITKHVPSTDLNLKEFVTLTEEKVASFEFSDLQLVKEVEEKKKRTRRLTKKVGENVLTLLRENSEIYDKTSEEQREKLRERLGCAINQTVRNYTMGANRATLDREFVIDKIDMKKLHQGFADVLKGVGVDIYAEIITKAIEIASKASIPGLRLTMVSWFFIANHGLTMVGNDLTMVGNHGHQIDLTMFHSCPWSESNTS